MHHVEKKPRKKKGNFRKSPLDIHGSFRNVDLIGFPVKNKGSRAAQKRCSVWKDPLELTRFVGRGTVDEAHRRVLTTALRAPGP